MSSSGMNLLNWFPSLASGTPGSSTGGVNSTTPPTSLTGSSSSSTNPYMDMSSLSSLLNTDMGSLSSPSLPSSLTGGSQMPLWYTGQQTQGLSGGIANPTSNMGGDQSQMLMTLLQQLLPLLGMGQ